MIANKVLWMMLLALVGVSTACSVEEKKEQAKELEVTEDSKIISLNGTVTEILVELGMEKNIIGTDVTSTYPESMNKVPKLGHSRTLSVEGVFSMKPTLVIGTSNDLNPSTIEKLQQSSVPVLLFEQDHSIEGTHELIMEVAKAVKREKKGKELIAQLDAKLKTVEKAKSHPKVLFIYARGAGTLMVAGEDTQLETMIELAGGENAAKGFSDFKPLTSEALLSANPEYILMFSSGMGSLNGQEGLLKVPGVAQTDAGKNRRFIVMDGQYLSGFSPRLPQAIQDLANALKPSED